MFEVWKPIRKHEGRYEVSNQGRIRRLAFIDCNNKPYKPRLKITRKSKSGYMRVRLSMNGVHKEYFVHRLVGDTFICPCPEGLQTNHKNGIKDDNRVANLEYITQSKNQKHRFDVLGHSSPRGEAHGGSKLTTNQVKEIRQRFINEGITKTKLGELYGVSRTTIKDVVNRITWTWLS